MGLRFPSPRAHSKGKPWCCSTLGVTTGRSVVFGIRIGTLLTYSYFQDSEGPQGPEPYLSEYEFGTLLTESLELAGFGAVEQIEYSYFDSLFVATK